MLDDFVVYTKILVCISVTRHSEFTSLKKKHLKVWLCEAKSDTKKKYKKNKVKLKNKQNKDVREQIGLNAKSKYRRRIEGIKII